MSCLDRWHAIKHRVSMPELFIDAGPSTLYSEAWGASRDWPKTLILGFEPCTRRYNDIKGSYPGTLYNKALSSVVGNVVGAENNYDFKLYPDIDKEDPYKQTVMESTTVDQLLKEHKTAFIWADVEGGELDIIRGAKDSLSLHKIVGLNLELWPTHTVPSVGWCSDVDVVNALKAHGYFVEDSYYTWDRRSQEDFLFLPEK